MATIYTIKLHTKPLCHRVSLFCASYPFKYLKTAKELMLMLAVVTMATNDLMCDAAVMLKAISNSKI